MNRARSALILLALTLLSGCAGQVESTPLPSSIAISPAFTPDQQEAVLLAVTEWRAASTDRASVEVSIGTSAASGVVVVEPASAQAAPATTGDTTRIALDVSVPTPARPRGRLLFWYLEEPTNRALNRAFNTEGGE